MVYSSVQVKRVFYRQVAFIWKPPGLEFLEAVPIDGYLAM